MTVIYIRHGNDEDDDSNYENDPGLRQDRMKEVIKTTQELIRKWGHPDVIYVSPMYRSLQTVQLMVSQLPGFQNVGVSPNLSRYFTSKELKRGIRAIRPQTLELKVPLGEDNHEFHRRIRKHHEAVKSRGWYRDDRPVVWCVTHALVMKRVSKYCHRKIPDHLDFLYYFKV